MITQEQLRDLRAAVAELAEQTAALSRRVERLEDRLGLDSDEEADDDDHAQCA